MKPTLSVIVALLFLAIATINTGFCYGSSYIGGIQSERQALLKFKQDLIDSSNRLASWTGEGDCCRWAGVVCDNSTGHILELQLRSPFNLIHFFHSSDFVVEAPSTSPLRGKINPSLLDLKQLIYLDLSLNDFGWIEIPKFLGSMRNLRYLNLSAAGFAGMIPHQLGNLSNLQYLDLGCNYYCGFNLFQFLSVENLGWLSSLSLLKHLDLSAVDLSKTSDWLSVTNTLPSLVVLHLSRCRLNYHPPLSIVNFSSLTMLDLSGNQFDNSLISSWVFGLCHLVFLDLSFSNLQGPIPNELQNLTSLRYLDLSANRFNYSIPCEWWYKLKDLEYLSLSSNVLRGAVPDAIGNLTSLRVLDLSDNYRLEGKIGRTWGTLCNLNSISLSRVTLSQEISEILDILSGCVSNNLELLALTESQLFGKLTNQLGKFRKLKTLDLQHNSIFGSIPLSSGKLSSLEYLNVGNNKFSGSIPLSLVKLSSLEYLNVGNNNLSGSIPLSLEKLSSLEYLNVGNNKLSGSIPFSLGELISLKYLDISYNKLSGYIIPIHLENLTRLSYFDASGNSLMMKVYPDWVPHFQLESLRLRSCHLGPQFPLWLSSQKHLVNLDISDSGISDSIPNRFWKSLSHLDLLNLSHNQIYGQIPNLNEAVQLEYLDLSSNNLSGLLPRVPPKVYALYLSNNALSGSIFHFLCYGMNMSMQMQILNLENNFLSGELPDCWMNWKNLEALILNNNKFTGNLPTSMGNLSFLVSLHLRNNSFSGILPGSLQSCAQLIALDIGENELFGNVPTWIGEAFSRLMFLNLRSNNLHGNLPVELCRLASLQILDLAHNNLSGPIPRCVNNLSAIVTMSSSIGLHTIEYGIDIASFIEDALLVMKGKVVEYNTILRLVRTIDLSQNMFSGEIPVEVTDLKALQSLNLSHNFFTGRIPETIGDMRLLESIDFSANQLFGEIPQSMSSLTFLSHLNLSNNKLIGKIPSSTQLQSLDTSSFIGNDLCGPPLPKSCTAIVPKPDFESGGAKDSNEDEVNWFYVSVPLGFVIGFWSIIGPLMVNKRWRYKYCHFLDWLEYKFVSVVRKCW